MQILNHITKQTFAAEIDDNDYVVTFYIPSATANTTEVATRVEMYDKLTRELFTIEDSEDAIHIAELVYQKCKSIIHNKMYGYLN